MRVRNVDIVLIIKEQRLKIGSVLSEFPPPARREDGLRSLTHSLIRIPEPGLKSLRINVKRKKLGVLESIVHNRVFRDGLT